MVDQETVVDQGMLVDQGMTVNQEAVVDQETTVVDQETAPQVADNQAFAAPASRETSRDADRNSLSETVDSGTLIESVDGEAGSSSFAELLKKTPAIDAQPEFTEKSASASDKISIKDQPNLVEQSLETLPPQRPRAELLSDTGEESGVGLLATDQIELPVRDRGMEPAMASQPETPNMAMIHATRLQEVAQGLLREAYHSLRRNANYTAKKKATAALRSLIAMVDAADGSNQHSRDFAAAMTAIRESREFGAGIQAVDNGQIQRLVAVHKTGVLKDKPLAEVSALGAMVEYLEFAQQKLVSAAGHSSEASYALQLLGQIEKRLKDPMDSQAAAIALTYQRSAVEVDPSNAIAHYELGKTYFAQGLPEQARIALTKSIELSPSRDAYEQLMATARKMGDIDTVRICKQALTDASLPSGMPVFELEPAMFAKLHQPQLAETQRGQNHNAQTKSPQHASRVNKSPQTKTRASSDVPTKTRISKWFSLNR
jgi:tetratricopeptide (TPR) repeat protein